MIATATCIISILLGVIIWFLNKLINELKKVWVIGANITNGIDQMTKSIDQYRADFKLTFDDKFARRVEEIVGLGIAPKDTMQIIGMDGKPHIVPIDKGY